MKRCIQKMIVFATILAPIAAWADVASFDLRPPSLVEIWTGGLRIFAGVGLPILVGGGIVNWVYRRIRHLVPLPGSAIFRRWFGWGIALFIVSIVLSALAPRLEMGGGPRSPSYERPRRNYEERLWGTSTAEERVENAADIAEDISFAGGE